MRCGLPLDEMWTDVFAASMTTLADCAAALSEVAEQSEACCNLQIAARPTCTPPPASKVLQSTLHASRSEQVTEERRACKHSHAHCLS